MKKVLVNYFQYLKTIERPNLFQKGRHAFVDSKFEYIQGKFKQIFT